MTTFKRHPEWLADWRATLAEFEKTEDDSDEHHATSDECHRLACLLAGTPALTGPELIAQFAWFNEQMGDTIRSNWCDELAIAVDRLGEGIRALAENGENAQAA